MKRLRQAICLAACLAVYALAHAADTAPTPAPANAKEDVEYMAVMLGDSKIGYGRNTRSIQGDRVTSRQYAKMTISRLGTSITIIQTSQSTETLDGRPLTFDSVMSMGGMDRITRGSLDEEGNVTVTTISGGQKSTKTHTWPEGALMSQGLWLLQKDKGLKKDTRYTFKVYQPEEAKALTGKAVVGERKAVDLLGRIVELTEIKVTMRMGLGQIVTTHYVDDELKTLKSIVPMLGMKFEMVACSKTFATSPDDVVDFFGKMVLQSPVPLANAGNASAITYHLQTSQDATVRIPRTDNQSVKVGQGDILVVTVKPVRPPKGIAMPYTGTDAEALSALKPTDMLQSEDPAVVTLAQKAIGNTKDAAEAAGRIEAFVSKYIKSKDLSVGYASASEVARSRQGDCTEHAVLVTALCRAVGIPAQIVTGMGYAPTFETHKNIFGPHAWARAYLGGKWIGLDAALGYDARHIALGFGDGDMEDFFGIVSSLGYFKIEKIEVAK